MRLISVIVFLCVSIGGLGTLVEGVCPTGCKCDDENLLVNCIDASLDIVPITLNPSVQRLILRSNKIRSIDHSTLSFYHELIHLDLSHNHLLRISPLSFASQTKLVQLQLNGNKISHLSNKTFGTPQTVMNSLAVLSVQNNLLDSLESGVFLYTPNLEELDLSQNSIRLLNTSAFLGLASLRILKLNNNELSQVPEVFSMRTIVPTSNSNSNNHGFGSEISVKNNMVPHLADLSLGYNPIEKIGNDAFSAAKNLVSLDLKGCRISTIEPNAFRGLGILRKLILTDNNLMAIPTTSFPPLMQLEMLKVGRNPFDRLSKYAFGGLKKLKNLEIGGAPELLMVEADAFSTNLDLENVDLYSCKKLAILPPRLFKGLSGLKNLNLKDNALQDLPEDLISWQSLRSLRVEGNPFRCVCELFWLRDLLSEEKFKNSSSFVLCAEPSELRDKKLTSLSSQDLNCYLQGPIQKTILGVSIAITVIILIVIFFLLYKYHERIKDTCKRGFRGGPSRRKHRSSVISSGKELDTATKTSFLSQSPYQFSDDDFQVRASLMSGSPGPGGGGNGINGGGYIHPSHTLNPVTMNSLNYPYGTNNYNSHSLHHPSHHYKSSPNNYASPNYSNEYDAPINSINFPHLHNQSQQQQIDHNLPIHYALHQHQQPHNVVKPIPITEL